MKKIISIVLIVLLFFANSYQQKIQQQTNINQPQKLQSNESENQFQSFSLNNQNISQNQNQQLTTKKQKLNTVYFLFQKSCFDQYHSRLSFGPYSCFSYIISKFLGYLIIAGSVFVRFPQIYLILKNKSVNGISYFGATQQLLMCSLSAGYPIFLGLPFSVYGQNIFNAIASFFICFTFLMYSKSKAKGQLIGVLLFVGIISSLFLFQIVSSYFQQISIFFQIVTIFTARGSQIIENFSNKSVGNLSFITVFLLFAGCVARSITILIEAKDQHLLLIGVVSGIILNSIILIQFYLYSGKGKKQ